jgi:hypothetical protein
MKYTYIYICPKCRELIIRNRKTKTSLCYETYETVKLKLLCKVKGEVNYNNLN